MFTYRANIILITYIYTYNILATYTTYTLYLHHTCYIHTVLYFISLHNTNNTMLYCYLTSTKTIGKTLKLLTTDS